MRKIDGVDNFYSLMPLGWIYGKIADARNAKFDRDSSHALDLGARTVSIGNITTGGTGKTPLVILVCQILAARGKRVCVLTRGYGRTEPKSRVLVSDGKKILSDAAHSGDEPIEIAKKLLGKALVVADADRVSAAKWAKSEFGANAFVLDDGFQHRRAKRDLDIVCIDGTNPFGGGKMLPMGRLREPLHNLKRAGAIVITRADLTPNLSDVKAEIARHAPDVPLFTAAMRMSELELIERFNAGGGASTACELNFRKLAHASAFAFCGLGNPEAFFGQLRRDNYTLSGARSFGDHHIYSQKDIALIDDEALSSGAGFLLTTPKDAVKLGGLKLELPCFVVNSEMILNDRDRFAAMI